MSEKEISGNKLSGLTEPVRAAVLVFPGTNCELDVVWALGIVGVEAEPVFHSDSPPEVFDLYVIPGGFSYGDYLRPGAIARFSPVMSVVRSAARCGKPVVGICNGFQILCEAGMLPGALQKNRGSSFLCQSVDLLVTNETSPLTCALQVGTVLRNIPINHFEGNFTIPPRKLALLESSGQIALRYCGPSGEVQEQFNPNGSMASIAGITDQRGNVAGIMPHPERAAEELIGSSDGLGILRSMALYAKRVKASSNTRNTEVQTSHLSK